MRAAVANPVAFFYSIRWATWLLAVVVVYTRSAPGQSLRFEPGLLMYAAAQLAVGMLYAMRSRPLPSPAAREVSLLKAPYNFVVAGIADMLGSLTLVYFSAGWGSPFWHFAVTSLLVPCFLLAPAWAMVTAACYAGGYVLVVAIGGAGLGDALAVGERSVFIGNLVSAFVIAAVMGYLGLRFRALEERLRAYAPRDETMSPDATALISGAGKALEALSEREREVLVLVAQGLTNKEIAGRLTISEKTARNHVSRVLEKLGLSRRSEAAAFAAQHGLLDGRPPKGGGG